jgi:hypothetical protein
MLNALILIITNMMKPTAMDIAKVSQEEYQRQLLIHKAKAKYHAKMLEYYEDLVGDTPAAAQ